MLCGAAALGSARGRADRRSPPTDWSSRRARGERDPRAAVAPESLLGAAIFAAAAALLGVILRAGHVALALLGALLWAAGLRPASRWSATARLADAPLLVAAAALIAVIVEFRRRGARPAGRSARSPHRRPASLGLTPPQPRRRDQRRPEPCRSCRCGRDPARRLTTRIVTARTGQRVPELCARTCGPRKESLASAFCATWSSASRTSSRGSSAAPSRRRCSRSRSPASWRRRWTRTGRRRSPASTCRTSTRSGCRPRTTAARGLRALARAGAVGLPARARPPPRLRAADPARGEAGDRRPAAARASSGSRRGW